MLSMDGKDMSSYCLGNIEFDSAAVNNELSNAAPFPFSDLYEEFICGQWKSCAIWNQSGFAEDVKIRDFSGESQLTDLGKKLPYITHIIKENFNLSYLRFARLVALYPSSIVLPHRDYLELKDTLTRIHIPLITDHHCFNSEENLVYHLDQGEVWYLNASLIHSAASFSKNLRLHLILDFYGDVVFDQIFYKSEKKRRQIKGIHREALPADSQQALLSLSTIINEHNFYDVLAILAKQHFFRDFSLEDFYEYLKIIADKSQDMQVIEKTKWLRDYCLAERQLAQ